MRDHSAKIRRFFTAYAKRVNDSLKPGGTVDTDGVVNAFAPYFVESSPLGVMGGKNGLRFRLSVPRGFAHYKKIGTTSMRVASLKVTPLDDLHVMATVAWDSRYAKDGKTIRIPFTNRYFLHIDKGTPRIFAYITGDEQQALKDHGVI